MFLWFGDYRCFNFADMGWFTRNIAATVFASPPTATYDEVNIGVQLKFC